MIDIKDSDFAEKFDPHEGNVGFIGMGYVGKAMKAFFEQAPFTFHVYDKAQHSDEEFQRVVSQSEIIFVAVPTPMEKDGSCHTGIVESVVKRVWDEAKRIDRPIDSFVLIVKSTVSPGFTEEMQERYFGLRILFSPEFLTEKNFVQDMLTTNRIILGGDEDDALVAFKYFQACIPERVENDETLLLQCDPTVAEMVKLYTNGILMTKILFSNEIFLLCQKLGIEYEEVRVLSILDRRIGDSHTSVPGHDGQMGAGGHCFPKDINNLRAFARAAGIPERIFSAVIDRNNEVREDKDWLRMQGRAVIDV